jgi:hypothetical protein
MTVHATATPRPARLEDADAIARIYDQGIEDRIGTCDALRLCSSLIGTHCRRS